jgi:hypothetical protein
MCHSPGYGQLNKFGYNFRAAGYRLPKDIGQEVNDGKFDPANYITARFSAGGTVKTTIQPGNVPVPDTGSFTLGGASIYLGGAFNKNYFCFSELALGNGTGIFSGSAPSLSSAKLGFVTGSENEFFTVRLGKISADGFAGSDRGPIGNPTIAGFVKPTGTGLELGYSHADTRVTLGFYNGIQNDTTTGLVNSSGKAVTSASIQAPASDTNNAKDVQLFVNQFIGDDGLAVNATFYNGFNDSTNAAGTVNNSANPDWAGQEYYNTALFLSSPVMGKFALKAGGELGQTNTGVFPVAGRVGPTTGGFFGELDYEADEITPLVLRCDYTSTDLNTKYTDTTKFTLGALTPLVQDQHVYMNPTYALTMTEAGAGYTYAQTLSDSLFVFF